MQLIKVLQTGSIFNFYNSGELILSHKLSSNKIFFFKGNNICLWLSAPRDCRLDSLNNHASGYKRSTSLKPLVSLRVIAPCFLIQWAHISFRGKSFRVRNFCRFNKFTFNFGYSHWTKLKLSVFWSFFKRRRQRYVIFTYSIKDFKYFTRFFPNIRRYNCYTMRGLRLKKQPIVRRFGKISQHVSILH